MKKFDIPGFYRSNILSRIKEKRRLKDPRKVDFSPTILNFEGLSIIIARHFGFCYGVENAIEIAYKIISENKGRRIFLLSEMIHNPEVNNDLKAQGVKFLMDTNGNRVYDWDELTSEDIVIIPAFGTTLEIQAELKEKGIDPYTFNTTCPFVEKVWNRAASLANENHTIIIHGKASHEETKATFSHSKNNTPSLIIKDIEEAEFLCKVILGEKSSNDFYEFFESKYSEGFVPDRDLNRVGIVNQTTMLSTETEAILTKIKDAMIKRYGVDKASEHIADTRDTLCYATYDNQTSTLELLNNDADFAVVIGGYNSSNTNHLVELLERKFKVYFINNANNFDENEMRYFNIHSKELEIEKKYYTNDTNRIIITSGASCPDRIVDEVIIKLLRLRGIEVDIDPIIDML